MEPEKITDFTAEQLSKVITEATKGTTKYRWITEYLWTLSKLLDKSPGAYRQFGAYWWPVKRMMIRREVGVHDWSESDIPPMIDRVSFGDDALDMAAAHSYSEYAFDNLANESNVHSHTVGDGTEDVQVWDDDLEIRMIRSID